MVPEGVRVHMAEKHSSRYGGQVRKLTVHILTHVLKENKLKVKLGF